MLEKVNEILEKLNLEKINSELEIGQDENYYFVLGNKKILKNSLNFFNGENKIKINKNEIIILKTEEQKKEEKKQKIEQEFLDTVSQITAGYTQEEINTWSTKVEEAKKVITGGKSEILEKLLIDGEKVEDLATIILTKAKKYADIYYQAEKSKRQKLKGLLEDKNKE